MSREKGHSPRIVRLLNDLKDESLFAKKGYAISELPAILIGGKRIIDKRDINNTTLQTLMRETGLWTLGHEPGALAKWYFNCQPPAPKLAAPKPEPDEFLSEDWHPQWAKELHEEVLSSIEHFDKALRVLNDKLAAFVDEFHTCEVKK